MLQLPSHSCTVQDELFEVLTVVQLGKLGTSFPVPIILCNFDGFYDGLLAFMKTCLSNGVLGAKGERASAAPAASCCRSHTSPSFCPCRARATAAPACSPAFLPGWLAAELKDLIIASDNKGVLDVLREVYLGEPPLHPGSKVYRASTFLLGGTAADGVEADGCGGAAAGP